MHHRESGEKQANRGENPCYLGELRGETTEGIKKGHGACGSVSYTQPTRTTSYDQSQGRRVAAASRSREWQYGKT